MKLGLILLTAVNAILPIVLLIMFGYILRRVNFVSKDFVKTGNKLVFNVFLPCMLFINVYDIDNLSMIQWDIIIYACIMICVIFLIGLVTAVLLTPVPERRGVILQCTFRSNFALIGIALAGALGGQEAEATAAIISAVTVPLFNILAVIALSIFIRKEDNSKYSAKNILINIAKNPLIIGVALGMMCLVIRTFQASVWGEPIFTFKDDTYFVYKTISNLKTIASPFSLLVLGGQFEFSAVRGLFKEIAVGTIFRTIVAPVIGIGGAILLSENTDLLNCGIQEYPALVALFGAPVAVSSAVMAGEMKNDEQLATQLVVWSSVCSIATIFLIVCVLMGLGYLPM